MERYFWLQFSKFSRIILAIWLYSTNGVKSSTRYDSASSLGWCPMDTKLRLVIVESCWSFTLPRLLPAAEIAKGTTSLLPQLHTDICGGVPPLALCCAFVTWYLINPPVPLSINKEGTLALPGGFSAHRAIFAAVLCAAINGNRLRAFRCYVTELREDLLGALRIEHNGRGN